VLESSDQMNSMAGRKNNEPLSVQMGQGTGSITGSQTASPMRHDKKQQSLSAPIIGIPVPPGASVQMVPIPTMGHMGQGQVGAIPPEFVPRAGMHYEGQQQGYLQQQQQQGGHQQYQSYVPYPANNQAYLHSQQPHIAYHQQMVPGVGVRPAQQQHYQHQGIGHDMSMMHQQQQQQQQQQHHTMGRGRPDERVENYATNYNGNNRAMNGYTTNNNHYRSMSASISDYPYDASYGANQQGGQVAAYYGPMPVQVAMDGSIPIPGGIIAVAAPLMGPEHERLLVLAKGNEQHKQVSDMLLKAAQSEAATSKKRCEELVLQVEDLKKQLEEVRAENEALRLAASDAETAVELKQAEGTAEKVREEAALSTSKRDLVATPPAQDSESDSDRESEPYSEQKVGLKSNGADKGQERHGTDQAATSLVKAVLLSPPQSSGGSPLAGAIKTAGTRRTWADADDEDDDEGVPTNRFDQRGAQQGRGQHPRSGSGQFEGVYKGSGKDRESDQYGRGAKQHSSSYSSTDKGRERDSNMSNSGGPGRGGAGRGNQGQGQNQNQGQGQGQGANMRGSSSDGGRGGQGGGAGNVARPLRPTRIIHPSGMPAGPGGQTGNRHDSASIDQGDGQGHSQGHGQGHEQSGDGQGQAPGPPHDSKIEANVQKGDMRKTPASSIYDYPKKGRVVIIHYYALRPQLLRGRPSCPVCYADISSPPLILS
jgi:hypothetical protein